MKLIGPLVSALLVVSVAGCGDEDTQEPETTTSGTSAVGAPPDPTGYDSAGAVPVPLGDVAQVATPADAVLDIRVPAGWSGHAEQLRCTATTGAGDEAELRAPETGENESFEGQEWMTLWTVSPPAGTEIIVGCTDPDSVITETADPHIRVVPRGLMP